MFTSAAAAGKTNVHNKAADLLPRRECRTVATFDIFDEARSGIDHEGVLFLSPRGTVSTAKPALGPSWMNNVCEDGFELRWDTHCACCGVAVVPVRSRSIRSSRKLLEG